MTLTRKERMALNKQLAPLGRRICGDCGRNLPLERAYWYFRRDGSVTGPCIRCQSAQAAIQQRWRSLSDEAQARRRAYWRAYMAQEDKRERHRAVNRERMRRIRAEQSFRSVKEKAS